ncbi:MAG: peptidoglycan binding domain-containing protein [Lachnospiraceae bacterium]|nr:peptidoglycan binding domain-containing protein [Lachnospiraceae bacterium]
MTKKKKLLLILAGVMIAVMAAAYTAMALYFRHHFYSNTTINGINCTEMDVQAAKQALSDEVRNYTLSLVKMDGTEEILTAEQMGLTFMDDGEVDQLLAEQNSWLWLREFFSDKRHELKVSVEIDANAVRSALEGLSCMQEGNFISPEDAVIVETETGFEITPEVEGNQLDLEKTVEAVCQAAVNGEERVDLEAAGCYLKPSIYRDNTELLEKLNRKNQLVIADLTMDFGSGRTETVNAALLKTWLVQDEAGNDAIDENQIRTYVSTLAEKYNTYHTTRYFEKTGGGTAVLTLGDYGWLIDEETTVSELSAAIAEGRQGTFEVTYENTAKSRALNDIGSSYVEISIDQQTMWCYVDGQPIVSTPVVTGCVANGTETPRGGVWKVKTRKTDYTMTGKTDPETGKPSYTAHCNYWVPYSEDLTIGLHDLVTRTAFGGDIYLTNGSHGCVNTPLEAMEQIFEVVAYGFPVVVY